MATLSNVLVLFLNIATLVFLAAALSSWFRVGYDSPFRPVIDGLRRITEPVLGPIRSVLPPLGGLDLSVLIVILVIRMALIPAAQQLG